MEGIEKLQHQHSVAHTRTLHDLPVLQRTHWPFVREHGVEDRALLLDNLIAEVAIHLKRWP